MSTIDDAIEAEIRLCDERADRIAAIWRTLPLNDAMRPHLAKRAKSWHAYRAALGAARGAKPRIGMTCNGLEV